MALALILDFIVIAALLVSAVIAFLRGFIREVLTIFGVIGGLLAAYFAGPLLSPVIAGWLGVSEDGETQHLFGILPYPVLADILAYGAVFIVVVLVLSIISHFLSGWAKAVGLGALDRTFGVLFGIARGVVMLALFYLPFYLLVDVETRNEWFAGSKTVFYVDSAAGFIAEIMPDSMASDMEEKVEKQKEAINEKMAEDIRERLQELDVLQNGDNKDQPMTQEELKTPDGYRDKERENMDKLIEGSVIHE